MWRRLSAHLQTQAVPRRSLPIPSGFVTGTSILTSPISRTPLFTRYFSSDAEDSDKSELRKRALEINPIATGPELEELEARVEGKDLFEFNHPVGPFGTKEAPAIVKSHYNKRIVGCPGGLGEDEHDVLWFWLEKDKPFMCPACEQYFMLEVIGEGGDPGEGYY